MTEEAFTGAAFRRFLGQGKLMGSQCSACGALHLPPRALCPVCYGETLDWVEMSGHGTLLAYTTIHIGPTAMIAAGYDRHHPYCTGIVQLDEGPAISAQIVGVNADQPETIEIGMPVRVVYLERGSDEEQRVHLAFEAVGG
jgi:uncharacterized OB-fold protein